MFVLHHDTNNGEDNFRPQPQPSCTPIPRSCGLSLHLFTFIIVLSMGQHHHVMDKALALCRSGFVDLPGIGTVFAQFSMLHCLLYFFCLIVGRSVALITIIMYSRGLRSDFPLDLIGSKGFVGHCYEVSQPYLMSFCLLTLLFPVFDTLKSRRLRDKINMRFHECWWKDLCWF